MTLPMNCRIVFAKNDRRSGIVLTQATEIIVDSSWKLLTSTAEIVIPRKVHLINFLPNNLTNTLRNYVN